MFSAFDQSRTARGAVDVVRVGSGGGGPCIRASGGLARACDVERNPRISWNRSASRVSRPASTVKRIGQVTGGDFFRCCRGTRRRGHGRVDVRCGNVVCVSHRAHISLSFSLFSFFFTTPGARSRGFVYSMHAVRLAVLYRLPQI